MNQEELKQYRNNYNKGKYASDPEYREMVKAKRRQRYANQVKVVHSYPEFRAGSMKINDFNF